MTTNVAEQLDILVREIEELLSTPKTSKFERLQPWFAQVIGTHPAEVAIKYISENKQTRNRLGERGSSQAILALLRNDDDLDRISLRVARLFEETQIAAEAVALATKRDDLWSVRSVFELEETGIADILKGHFPDLVKQDFPGPIIRSMDFPDEYREAGVQILSYFGRVLRQRFPEMPSEVSVSQQGDQITLIVKMPGDRRNEVKETLIGFGNVVMGGAEPEDFESDPEELRRLRKELEFAELRIQHELQIRGIQSEELKRLRRENSEFVNVIKSQSSFPKYLHVHGADATFNFISQGDSYTIPGQAGAIGPQAESSSSKFRSTKGRQQRLDWKPDS